MSRRLEIARALWGAGVMALTLALGAPLWGQQQMPVQEAVVVRPDTVRVGDPFHVVVAIRAPRGATIEFPAVPDSTSTVQAIDPRVVTTVSDPTGVRQNADYRVAAWDIGRQPIKLGDVVVRLNGVERRVQIVGYSVFVRSVLPLDSTKRLPKPARDLFEPTKIPWWVWALLAVAILLGLLLWWWWTHRKRPNVGRATIDPYQRALREFARVDGLGLLEAGERGRYVALTVEVLRAYLADRIAQAPMSLTSIELLEAIAPISTLAAEPLRAVLHESDLIKFANRSVSAQRAGELARESRAIVDAEHAASQPALEAAA